MKQVSIRTLADVAKHVTQKNKGRFLADFSAWLDFLTSLKLSAGKVVGFDWKDDGEHKVTGVKIDFVQEAKSQNEAAAWTHIDEMPKKEQIVVLWDGESWIDIGFWSIEDGCVVWSVVESNSLYVDKDGKIDCCNAWQDDWRPKYWLPFPKPEK